MTPTDKLWDISDKLYVPDLAKYVLKLPYFKVWTGCANPKGHHYGKGGLAQHVLEVCELALLNNKYYGSPVDEAELFLACLFHDVGKLWDYIPTESSLPKSVAAAEVFGPNNNEYKDWVNSDHKYKIHHITRSILVWNEAFDKENWDGRFEWDKDEVTHAILAHHGRREYGSPVEPQSKLAWLLHSADMISARLCDSPS